jgi:Flp pilus assembly protein TadB
MEKHDRGNNFLNGLVFGALIGAGLAFFLASDEKTKKKLKRKGRATLENLGELVAEVEEKGKKFSQEAQKVKAELEEKAKSGELGKETREKLAHIDKLRERGRKATGRFFTRSGKKLS